MPAKFKVDPPAESQLVRRLLNSEFALTAEITPPVAASAETLLDKALPLKDWVDAVNVTDGASARVSMSSLAAAAILAANGIEPVIQFTCRDRNRIALMSDLLGAAALGVHNILIITGDDPTAGDQPGAKAVFDLTSQELIDIAAIMTADGNLPAYNVKDGDGAFVSRPIAAPPKFFLGAADTPTATADEKWSSGLHLKIGAGAQFIQTQLCYDMDVIRQYAKLLVDEGFTEKLFFLIGNGPLVSAKSAIWMRDNLWGVIIPDDIIERLEKADDAQAEGIRICIDQMQEMADMPEIAGVHLMAPINTGSIPEVIEASKLR